jgi:hypothetical protein
VDIKPCLSRYEGKVTDHNFGSLIRMNAEEEYSESNTIFGAFREPVPGSVTELLGSDAGAVFGFRGECCVGITSGSSNTNTATRSLATVWD